MEKEKLCFIFLLSLFRFVERITIVRGQQIILKDGVLEAKLKDVKLHHTSIAGGSLVGTIPPSIGDLTQLTAIAITSNCSLQGTLPTQIGKLSNLEHFDVQFNSLTGTIPKEIGKLSKLTGLNLHDNKLSGTLPILLSTLEKLSVLRLSLNKWDINCDDEFLSWYPELSAKVDDKYDTSLLCSGQVYPFNLKRDEFDVEPRFRPENINGLPSRRGVMVSWTYPNLARLKPFDFKPNGGYDHVKFHDCQTYGDNRNLNTTVHRGVGFEITLKQQSEDTSSIVVRRCLNSEDISAVDGVFHYFIDTVSPATQFDLTVRPLNIHQTDALHVFIFGPSSKNIPFTTKDDIPEAAPVNVRSISATESSIELTWEETPELGANGKIIEYEVHSITDGQNYNTSGIRQITIAGLEPNNEYQYQIRAATSAGFSDIYSDTLSTRTCPPGMKRSDEANCFAVQGSFLVSETEALVCEVEIPDVVAGCETEEQLTVQTLDILPGFWRPSVNDFTEIRACPVPQFCSKERRDESATVRILTNGTEFEPESKQCSLFHRGVYCSSCDDGYALSGADGCIECTDDLKENHHGNYVYFIVFISVVILICMTYVFIKVTGLPSCCYAKGNIVKICTYCKWKMWNSLWKRFDVKLRILEGFLQVMFAFQSVLYTDAAQSFLNDALGAIANLNPKYLANGFEVDCAIDVNHYFNLLLYTLPPLVLALLLFVLYRVATACRDGWKEKLRKECFNIFFVISFLIYPGVSKVIFDTFFCEDFDTVDEESEYIFQSALRADYRLSCSFGADGRVGWLVYAVLMVLIFPMGILMTYVYFLLKYKQEFLKGENRIVTWMLRVYDFVFRCKRVVDNDESKAVIEDLVKELVYPYDIYWFEAYELVRKLLQTAFVSFFLLFGTQATSSVALNLSVAALLVLVYLNPYKNKTDFCFAVVSLTTLVFATQLTVWFHTEDCDRACRTERTGDAIGWIVLFMLLAFLFFLMLDKLMYWEGFTWEDDAPNTTETRVEDGSVRLPNVADEAVIDGEIERLQSDVERLQREKNNLSKEKNDLQQDYEEKFSDLQQDSEKKLEDMKQESEREIELLLQKIEMLTAQSDI